jgi:hypothetical protein
VECGRQAKEVGLEQDFMSTRAPALRGACLREKPRPTRVAAALVSVTPHPLAP